MELGLLDEGNSRPGEPKIKKRKVLPRLSHMSDSDVAKHLESVVGLSRDLKEKSQSLETTIQKGFAEVHRLSLTKEKVDKKRFQSLCKFVADMEDRIASGLQASLVATIEQRLHAKTSAVTLTVQGRSPSLAPQTSFSNSPLKIIRPTAKMNLGEILGDAQRHVQSGKFQPAQLNVGDLGDSQHLREALEHLAEIKKGPPPPRTPVNAPSVAALLPSGPSLNDEDTRMGAPDTEEKATALSSLEGIKENFQSKEFALYMFYFIYALQCIGGPCLTSHSFLTRVLSPFLSFCSMYSRS